MSNIIWIIVCCRRSKKSNISTDVKVSGNESYAITHRIGPEDDEQIDQSDLAYKYEKTLKCVAAKEIFRMARDIEEHYSTEASNPKKCNYRVMFKLVKEFIGTMVAHKQDLENKLEVKAQTPESFFIGIQRQISEHEQNLDVAENRIQFDSFDYSPDSSQDNDANAQIKNKEV